MLWDIDRNSSGQNGYIWILALYYKNWSTSDSDPPVISEIVSGTGFDPGQLLLFIYS